jgi:hypothetical protein
MKLRVLYRLVLLGLVFAVPAGAQTYTVPVPVQTTTGSSTITVTSTFQNVFSANATRKGCLIINTDVNEQWVFFGPIANATKALSVPLNPATSAGLAGGQVTCATTSGGVLTDQISITGTATGTFVANSQQ